MPRSPMSPRAIQSRIALAAANSPISKARLNSPQARLSPHGAASSPAFNQITAHMISTHGAHTSATSSPVVLRRSAMMAATASSASNSPAALRTGVSSPAASAQVSLPSVLHSGAVRLPMSPQVSVFQTTAVSTPGSCSAPADVRGQVESVEKMIAAALAAAGTRKNMAGGVNFASVRKFIIANFAVEDTAAFQAQLRLALKRGVKDGSLDYKKERGASSPAYAMKRSSNLSQSRSSPVVRVQQLARSVVNSPNAENRVPTPMPISVHSSPSAQTSAAAASFSSPLVRVEIPPIEMSASGANVLPSSPPPSYESVLKAKINSHKSLL